MSNAKQIALCCKQYAVDHDGQFPGYAIVNGTLSKDQISDYSNTAFNQLFPDYMTTVEPFYQPKSAWTPAQMSDPSPVTWRSARHCQPAPMNGPTSSGLAARRIRSSR